MEPTTASGPSVFTFRVEKDPSAISSRSIAAKSRNNLPCERCKRLRAKCEGPIDGTCERCKRTNMECSRVDNEISRQRRRGSERAAERARLSASLESNERRSTSPAGSLFSSKQQSDTEMEDSFIPRGFSSPRPASPNASSIREGSPLREISQSASSTAEGSSSSSNNRDSPPASTSIPTPPLSLSPDPLPLDGAFGLDPVVPHIGTFPPIPFDLSFMGEPPPRTAQIEDGFVDAFVHVSDGARFVGVRYLNRRGEVMREDKFIKRLDDFVVPPPGTAHRLKDLNSNSPPSAFVPSFPTPPTTAISAMSHSSSFWPTLGPFSTPISASPLSWPFPYTPPFLDDYAFSSLASSPDLFTIPAQSTSPNENTNTSRTQPPTPSSNSNSSSTPSGRMSPRTILNSKNRQQNKEKEKGKDKDRDKDKDKDKERALTEEAPTPTTIAPSMLMIDPSDFPSRSRSRSRQMMLSGGSSTGILVLKPGARSGPER